MQTPSNKLATIVVCLSLILAKMIYWIVFVNESNLCL